MNRPRAWMLLVLSTVVLASIAPPRSAYAQRPFPIQFKPRGFVPRHTQYSPPVSRSTTTQSQPRNGHAVGSHVAPESHRAVFQQTQYEETGQALPSGQTMADAPPYEEAWDGQTTYSSDESMVSYAGESYGEPWYGDTRGFSPLWGRAEYLLWWTKGMNVPPLATTSEAGTNQDQAGVLGLATTDVLFGNRRLNDASRSGGRFTLGWWLDPAEMSGIEANYFMLGDETSRFAADDDDFAILARPFFNTTLNAEDSRLLVFPGLVEGQVTMDMSTSLQGVEVLYRRAAARSQWAEIDYFMGYRYAELDDRLRIDETTTALSGPLVGSSFALFDQFDAANTFHGGQLGMRLLRHASPGYTVEFLGKFAVGGTRTRTNINGQTITTAAAGGGTTTAAGGLLALPTNIGSVEDQELSTITEFGATLRHQVTSATTLSIGYTLLYWSDVARVGEIVDTTINPSQIPPGTLTGERRPTTRFVPTDFWAQGLNLGLEFRF